MNEENRNNHTAKDREEMREVEVKKSIIPLEERMLMFTQLLREKQVWMNKEKFCQPHTFLWKQCFVFYLVIFTFKVSAFSTWEKELHKILFDPRYLLLNMKERKTCYEKYVRVRAVEERKERIQKLKEKKEEFKVLLDEVITSSR